MKIIIYATHDEGTFNELSKHKNVIVLGFGSKWDGFIGKAREILKYLNSLPDDEIVISLDGFDSYIKKDNHDQLLNLFKNMNCKVLYSLDSKHGLYKYSPCNPEIITSYIQNKIHGECKNGYVANAGMYMGYVKYLKIVLNSIINCNISDDDQRNLNQLCDSFPFLEIDYNGIIFENCSNIKEVKNSNAFFCSIPGTPSFNRIIRIIPEYSQFFILEIVFLFILIFTIITFILLKNYI
jgi:hypothetical protein